MRGSSPLARGLPHRRARYRRAARIIPARAGFTLGVQLTDIRRRDHPRSRGVYPCVRGLQHGVSGSSPLARGLLLGPLRARFGLGIIPARAGFTWTGTTSPSPRTDHPRSRGVYWPTPSSGSAPPGSSPLARGLPWRPGPVAMDAGIIPARAGFTRPRLQRHLRRRDHPRSRGVYWRAARRRTGRDGSSPLARGLRARAVSGVCQYRIIPARAGFTPSRSRARSGRADHPRSRGVYFATNFTGAPSQGSSPLARGLPRVRGHGHRTGRIIPARAGFTPLESDEGPEGPGSSPLARGLR